MSNVAVVTNVAFCGCTNTQLEAGKSCGQVECPNHQAIKILGFESERDRDEVLGYVADGNWNPVVEIAEQHAHTQMACMNAGVADELFAFAELARAKA